MRLTQATTPRRSGRLRATCSNWRPFATTRAVGDNLNDLELLRAADRAFIVEPKSPRLRNVPGVVEVGDFVELAGLVDREGWLKDEETGDRLQGDPAATSEPVGAQTDLSQRPSWPHAA